MWAMSVYEEVKGSKETASIKYDRTVNESPWSTHLNWISQGLERVSESEKELEEWAGKAWKGFYTEINAWEKYLGSINAE